MTPKDLKSKLVEFSPFTLEATKDKFQFYQDTVSINEAIPVYYDTLQTYKGLEIRIDNKLLNFFNVIVVFGQTQSDRQVVNFDSQKLNISLPKRPQFVGLISNKIV
jgi:hypothetical protein